MKGLVHIYTGDGKGKTTAAIGLCIRALGRGYKILLIQFLKGQKSGEIEFLKKINADIKIVRQEDIKSFFWNMNDEQKKKVKKSTDSIIKMVSKEILSNVYNMIVLDEVFGAINNGLIEVDTIKELIRKKADGIELVLTGRNASSELVDLADYVSFIKAVKHPSKKGIPSRIGIEK